MSCVILLGAGASKGTLGEQAPVAKDFGQYLNRIVPNWSQNYPYLATAIRFLEQRISDTSENSWALDKVWSAIDNRVKLQYILGLSLPGAPFPPPRAKRIYELDLDPWGLAGFELRCAVAHVYGVELEPAIQNAVEGNGTIKKEIEKLRPGDCVISFNYDLLAERILEKLNKKVTIANYWLDNTNIDNTILLCKPHGSLNWKQRVPENGRAVQILDYPMQEDETDSCPELNVTIQPGIAAPVPFKSEIIIPELQLGSVLNFFKLLVAQWRCLIQCISKAEKFIILGYGFPPEDLHARYLFAEAVAKRESNKKLEIEMYEISEQRFKKLKETIVDLFKTTFCEYRGPVEP
nr:SIR2 family protein [Candidatus Freyarchaeota archaeon]